MAIDFGFPSVLELLRHEVREFVGTVVCPIAARLVAFGLGPRSTCGAALCGGRV